MGDVIRVLRTVLGAIYPSARGPAPKAPARGESRQVRRAAERRWAKSVGRR